MKKKVSLFLLFFTLFQFNLKAQAIEKIGKLNEETKKVILIYGSPDCHYCTDTKNILIENKIDFIFYDIDTDKAALNEMLAKLRKANINTNNLGIPVIDKYGEVFTNNTAFDDFIKKIIP
ncbi:glutaredoxin family protein [Flavobacterium sp. ZT3R18]|uniref:glutaredoxin family protein n=1 Tax=Flavobacterium sp. ZT3R18 TaxID=2594429 RepID=UPI00163D9F52|nr:glutaredoxin family protein [Flavobacterium sp. ZT3R18]